ncbi:MAG: ATP-binding protein [Clostridiaceae bacterium]|nr:ATP-binding protein [Clostridiaceae bacterium]
MFQRPYYLNRLIKFKDSDFIKIITGVRRSGKSVLLKLYVDYLKNEHISEENIIYINFEEFEYQTIKLEEDFRKLILEKTPRNKNKIYYLFDEIQLVEGWQKVVNSLRVSYDCDIVITGSNAKMLSGELATLLSGRYVEIPVYPLSFQEFLTVKQVDNDSRMVDKYYSEYEKYGGFPGVVLAQEEIKDTILSGIFDSIVLNDIAYRSGIRDTFVLKDIILYLADNVGQLVNPSIIANVLKNEKMNTSNHTVNRYLDLLENAYLFFRVRQYDLRGKAYLKTNAKYFIVDNGLRRHTVGKKDGNFGNRLENIVFLELLRRGYTVDIGRIDTKEIDFIARKVDEQIYIQVTYEMPKDSREIDNLLLIKDNYKKIIVTGRYFEEKNIRGIPIIYIVDWLLDE